MARRVGLMLTVIALIASPAASVVQAAESGSPQAEIERLSAQISSLDEEYNDARVHLNDVEHQIRQLEADKQSADERVSTLRATASERAAAAYRLGMPDTILMLFAAESISDFQRRLGVASKVGSWESEVMEELTIANQRAEDTAKDLAAERDRAQKLTDSIAKRRGELQDRADALQAIVIRQATAVSRQGAPTLVASETAPQAPPPLGEGSIKTLLATAYSQIGKPYAWGASGPGSYDCSGFVLYSYRSIGISLPHSSRAQYAATKRVSRDQLRPGDLVFFGSPIHHVGIYVGGGNMIDSSTYGRPVGVRSINRRGYVGAGRVIG